MIASAVVQGAAVAAVLLLLLGCSDGDGGPVDDASGGDGRGPDAATGRADDLTTSDTIPDDLDVRLTRRITGPLGDGVLVRFQHFNRGPDPRVNYWWELSEDGAVRFVRHSPDTSDPDTPFDTPLPAEPVTVLDGAAVEAVRASLETSGFASQPRYQEQPGVEDGAFNVVTARLPDGGVREVVYEAAAPAPVDALQTLTERITEESS